MIIRGQTPLRSNGWRVHFPEHRRVNSCERQGHPIGAAEVHLAAADCGSTGRAMRRLASSIPQEVA
jgi:hypothetical protein